MLRKYGLRFVALGYLALLLLMPVVVIFYRAFDHGLDAAWAAVTTPEAQHAFYLTFILAAIAVPLNTVFGIALALTLERTDFRGKGLVNAAVDLPFAISPVVVGLSLVLVYGRLGWFGQFFADHGIQIIFSTPGMVLATIFVCLPFVVREELRDWLRRLHEEVNVTTIVVTHDQQEAMEVADQIVVVNEGRIEQIGSPAEVYEKPKTNFVMEFVGPVTRVGENVVRPHDLEILQDAAPGAVEAIVQRVVRLGFEVRAELLPADGPQFSVQLTRAEADELELADGDIVWVRADRARVSAPA